MARVCLSCRGHGRSTALCQGRMVECHCPSCGGLGFVADQQSERMHFGQRLREERLARKIKLAKAAELCGVSSTTFSMAEQGETQLTRIIEFGKVIKRIARPNAIGTSPLPQSTVARQAQGQAGPRGGRTLGGEPIGEDDQPESGLLGNDNQE